MNWIIWMTFAIILIGILIGVYRGALRIAVSIVTFILTIAITFFVTPYVSQIVMDKTPVDDSIRDYVIRSMEDAANAMLVEIVEEEIAEEVAEEVTEEAVEEALDEAGVSAEELVKNTEIPRDIQIQAIEKAELPDAFKGLLKENNNDEIYGMLGVETFAQYTGTYLAKLMVHIATFLALFLIVTIVLRAFIFALNIVNDIPVFGIVNRLAGGFLGIVCSLMVIWFFFSVVTLFYTTDIGRQAYDTILGNDYLKIIYENNPLFNLSIKI